MRERNIDWQGCDLQKMRQCPFCPFLTLSIGGHKRVGCGPAEVFCSATSKGVNRLNQAERAFCTNMAPPPTLVSAHAPPHMSTIHLSLRHFKPALLQKKAARLHGLGPTCLLVTCLLVAEGPPSSLSHRHGIHTQTAIHQAPDPPSSLFSLHDRLSPSSLSLQGCAQQKGGGAVSLFHVSHLFTRLD